MHKLTAYLQLLRLPAVFTAMADIFLGYLMNHSSLERPAEFALLLTASSGLYLSGMVFNDVFDRKTDADGRPGRPIPSGRVSVKSAVILAVALMALGVVASACVGRGSLLIAVCLCAAILGYNGILKRTPLGPLAMGSCRFLNVMLGASAGNWVWGQPQLPIAAGLGVYIVGVTWFARTEAETSRSRSLVYALGVINTGLAVLVCYVAGLVGRFSGGAEPEHVYPVFLIVFLSVNRRGVAAVLDPSAAKVQAAIKISLLSLVVLDATLIYFKLGDPVYAVATVALLLPAVLLARWIPMT